jgi:hypothetical protein
LIPLRLLWKKQELLSRKLFQRNNKIKEIAKSTLGKRVDFVLGKG